MEFKLQRNCYQSSSSKQYFGLVKMTLELKYAYYSLAEQQAVKLTFFAPWVLLFHFILSNIVGFSLEHSNKYKENDCFTHYDQPAQSNIRPILILVLFFRRKIIAYKSISEKETLSSLTTKNQLSQFSELQRNSIAIIILKP